MSAAQYRILSPAGVPREDGQADVDVTGGALVLAPAAGSTLHIPFGQILLIAEPEPFTVRITLADGNAIELRRLGVMRTQLLGELRDGRAADIAAAAAAVGEAAIFSAVTASAPVEVRVYEDALLVISAADGERIGFSFMDAARVRDYAVTVEVAGREPLVLSRLGRRTDELLTLLQIATLPAGRDAVADLARRTDLAIGFKQLVSVRRPATGVTPWQDHAATPHIGQHESPGGIFGFGEGYALYGGYWAFRALGAGLNTREQPPMAARPDLTRGCLTPVTDDLSALTATGESPTVLAFALGSHAGRVVYEALNQPGPALVYQADEPGGLAAVNRALDDAGFQVAALHGQGLAVPAAHPNALIQALAGQVHNDAQWPERIAALLAG